MADHSQPLLSTDSPARSTAPTSTDPSSKLNITTTTMDINGSNTPGADLAGASASASATQVRPGGAPARVYLNDKIVPHLLEGMKSVAREQPSNPLRVLGEFLIQKSEEVEGDAKKE